MGDLSSIPRLGRCPGGGHGNPLQYSCLENRQVQRSPVGCCPWGRKQSDMTEWLSTAQHRGFTEKAREFQKNINFCSIDYAKVSDCMEHNKLQNSERDGNTRPPYLPPEKLVCRSRSNSWNCWEIGKGVCQGCILSPCLFNLYAEYIMWSARLNEAQARIQIAGRNINNLRYSDNTHSYGRKQRRTKEPLDESERGKWKIWLKTQHSKN